MDLIYTSGFNHTSVKASFWHVGLGEGGGVHELDPYGSHITTHDDSHLVLNGG